MFDERDESDESDEPRATEDPIVDHECVRPWITEITSLLAAHPLKAGVNPKVQAALDRFMVVAMDRATRVLRGDINDR